MKKNRTAGTADFQESQAGGLNTHRLLYTFRPYIITLSPRLWQRATEIVGPLDPFSLPHFTGHAPETWKSEVRKSSKKNRL
jgi:hypothetical protein